VGATEGLGEARCQPFTVTPDEGVVVERVTDRNELVQRRRDPVPVLGGKGCEVEIEQLGPIGDQ
jgi:hypothetical protein